MKFSMSDPDTAKALSASRQLVLEAVDSFSFGLKDSITIAALLEPLDLFMKNDLGQLYFLTAVGAFTTRIKGGLISKHGKGRAAYYYRVHADNIIPLPEDDSLVQFRNLLPELKQSLVAFLIRQADGDYFTIDTVFTFLMPDGCGDINLARRIRRFISSRLFRMETKGALRSLGSKRPKRYYLP